MEQQTVRKNLRHLAAVIPSQRAEFNQLVTEIRKLNGFVFWAEQRFAKIVAPFDPYAGLSLEEPVTVPEKQAEALDEIAAQLRVHVETVKTYLVWLDSAKVALMKLSAAKELLAKYPGGVMPGKDFPAGRTEEKEMQRVFHNLSQLAQRIDAQIRVLNEALGLASEGKITDAVDFSASAFALVATVQSLAKGMRNDTIALLPSKTIQ